ncbi:hypothetical protein HMI54_010659, partial [Coelomomyces lativittatus]
MAEFIGSNNQKVGVAPKVMFVDIRFCSETEEKPVSGNVDWLKIREMRVDIINISIQFQLIDFSKPPLPLTGKHAVMVSAIGNSGYLKWKEHNALWYDSLSVGA